MTNETLVFPAMPEAVARRRKMSVFIGFFIVFLLFPAALMFLHGAPIPLLPIVNGVIALALAAHLLWRLVCTPRTVELREDSIRLNPRIGERVIPLNAVGGTYVFATRLPPEDRYVFELRSKTGRRLTAIVEEYQDFHLLVEETRRRIAQTGGTPGDAASDKARQWKRRRTLRWLGMGACLFGLVIIPLPFFADYYGDHNPGTPAKGTVVAVEHEEYEDYSVSGVDYVFHDDTGKEYSGRGDIFDGSGKEYTAGDTLEIRYDREDPEFNYIARKRSIKAIFSPALVIFVGLPLLFCVAGLVLLGLGYELATFSKGPTLVRPHETMEDAIERVRKPKQAIADTFL